MRLSLTNVCVFCVYEVKLGIKCTTSKDVIFLRTTQVYMHHLGGYGNNTYLHLHSEREVKEVEKNTLKL